jgi:hypothetical protein
MSRKTQYKHKRRQKKRISGGATTRKHRPTTSIDNARKSNIVKVFLELLNMVKLYHWKTHSYSQHKATDDLYSSINEHMDDFIEVLMGKDEGRIQMIEKKLDIIDLTNIHNFKTRIYEYREFLINMHTYLSDKTDTDLLNIRDELLGDVNKFLYLLTLDH